MPDQGTSVDHTSGTKVTNEAGKGVSSFQVGVTKSSNPKSAQGILHKF